MIGIYKITNTINNKCYIGQSININRRWRQEKNKAFNPNDPAYKTLLSAAFRKYGVENFTFEIIEQLTINQLNEHEIYWIANLNSLKPNGYNMQAGGVYSYNPNPENYSILTYEEVEEIYEWLLQGCPITYIAADFGVGISTISDINQGRTWRSSKYQYPIHQYSYQGKKIGQYLLDGTLINIYNNAQEASRLTNIMASSISTIARTNGTASRKTAGGYMWRIIEDENTATNIKPIEYVCDNQHQHMKKQNKTARGKPILQFTKEGVFIQEFDNMKSAELQTGVSLKQISAVIHNKNKTAGGFIWKLK